jgi:hypothetical protein
MCFSLSRNGLVNAFSVSRKSLLNEINAISISVRWYEYKVMLVVVLEVLDDDIDQLGNNVSRDSRLADFLFYQHARIRLRPY